ncbi:MAG TPA: ferric reductase-like transmembrane domain-containing protein [Paracoccus sp. (in: a-proteobacteria)]|uniref:ferredoxin reductase family protein n=1 Tax=Paracoccus sp. TaxID=267 RepID=UPI002C8532CD|nr:ferric reductase-like transmembrane domain-containing protein [Paracoccus sp. (in: a-proteobacteria)]HWL56758.1 ferric reductase-like transmembrane domain-containing protein [Paracoccus sp. (in: a-proteobacteria)]
MGKLTRIFWIMLAVPIAFWLLTDSTVFQAPSFFPLRSAMVQITGILAIGCMSVATVMALRPLWLEARVDGLDKVYRLHKWLGIAALVASVLHWLWAKGPRWAVEWGLMAPRPRGPRPTLQDPLQIAFSRLHGPAEQVGEWAFYAVLVLILVALLRVIPYRAFYKTHRLIAAVYLLLVFHAVVLMKFSYWSSLIGVLMAVLLGWGTYAAIVALLRRIGASRQVQGDIRTLHYYPGVQVLETEIGIADGWPGHKAGQFAFARSDPSEGAHPYTIASDWRPERPGITFLTKELGDHTSRLREKVAVGQAVRVEGPYGCFTFDDDRPRQIWIAGGIGITPFVARMKHLAWQSRADGRTAGQSIDLFHSTADVDREALDNLAADVRSSAVRLHLMVDARDGRLTGEQIRKAVPGWEEASIWFCGPVGFGNALKQDFARHGFPVQERFHQEFFDLR